MKKIESDIKLHGKPYYCYKHNLVFTEDEFHDKELKRLIDKGFIPNFIEKDIIILNKQYNCDIICFKPFNKKGKIDYNKLAIEIDKTTALMGIMKTIDSLGISLKFNEPGIYYILFD